MNKLIDGKLVSSNILNNIKEEIDTLEIKPTLVVIQVGNMDASTIYVRNKEKAAIKVGINFKCINFEEKIEESIIISEIEKLNKDKNINGIIVQLPLPKHLNSQRIINAINPIKDVDGLTTLNLGKLINNEECLTSCTPTGIMYLLDEYKVEIEGKNVVIVGRSTLVGKPLIHMLLNKNATVTICHSKTVNLEKFTKTADILIVAVGKKHLIKKEMVKENSTIIDVGINKVDGKLYGDVDTEEVLDKVNLITPVPGGVGPMTIAILLKNTLKSYHLMQKK